MPRILDREGFRRIIVGLSGLHDGAVVWDLAPAPIIGDSDRALVTLEIFNISAVHVDEHRAYYFTADGEEPNGAAEFFQVGNRHVVITMRAEAFDVEEEATEILDRIRTGVRADAITAQLDALNLAFVWAEPTMRFHKHVDTRVVNSAICDFTFAGIAQQITRVIPPNAGGDYIQTVNTTNLVPGTYS